MPYRVGQEKKAAGQLEQEIRQRIAKAVDGLELEELDELQDWLEMRQEAERQALIKSITALISDMTIEALEELEASLAESD